MVIADPNQPNSLNQQGQGPSTSGTSSAAPTSTYQAKPKGSGRFSNIQSYIGANKDFEQNTGGLGGKVASNIEEQGNKTASAIQQQKAAFQTNADKENQNLQTAQGWQTTLKEGTGQDLQDLANPNQMHEINRPQDMQYNQNLQANPYSGPDFSQYYSGKQTDLGGLDTTGLGQQVGNVQEQGKLTGSEQGRFQLLNSQFGRPTYSSGQQNLDQLILQGAPGQLQNLQTRANQAGQAVGQNLNQASQYVTDTTGQLQNQFGQTQQGLQAALQGRVGGLQNTLNQRVAQTQAESQAQQAKILAAAQGKAKLSAEELAGLGLDPNMKVYDLDLSQFINQNSLVNPDINLGNVANAEDYQAYGALSKLGSLDQSSSLSQALADKAKAGTAKTLPGFSENTLANIKSAAEDAKNRMYAYAPRTDMSNRMEEIFEHVNPQAATDAQHMKDVMEGRTAQFNFGDNPSVGRMEQMKESGALNDAESYMRSLLNNPAVLDAAKANNPGGYANALARAEVQRKRTLDAITGYEQSNFKSIRDLLGG